MKNGVTSTNLHIPVPQNFLGANGWKIPLRPMNGNATACWNFQFVNADGKTTQPPVNYCK